VIVQALSERELNGENVSTLIDRIASADLYGVRSISAVLHGRLAQTGGLSRWTWFTEFR
jgi:hypothetical protein